MPRVDTDSPGFSAAPSFQSFNGIFFNAGTTSRDRRRSTTFNVSHAVVGVHNARQSESL